MIMMPTDQNNDMMYAIARRWMEKIQCVIDDANVYPEEISPQELAELVNQIINMIVKIKIILHHGLELKPLVKKEVKS
jgi:hypothetical protein